MFCLRLWAKTSTGCVFGGSALGKRGREAEEDGHTAATEILECAERRACLDSYAQDQVCSAVVKKLEVSPLICNEYLYCLS